MEDDTELIPRPKQGGWEKTKDYLLDGVCDYYCVVLHVAVVDTNSST